MFLAPRAHPDGVGTGFGASLQALQPLRQRILHLGARDDHQVFVTSRIDGCFNLRDELLFRNHADVEALVTCPLGRHLIFDVNRGDPGTVEFSHRSRNVHYIAVTRLGIADDGELHGVDNLPRAIDHLGEREQPRIGEAQGAMLAAARNMHERKSKPFDQARLNAVIATRRDVTSRSLHHFAQCFSFVGCRRFHVTFPFSHLWILTQWWQGRGIRLVYSPRRTRWTRRDSNIFDHKLRTTIPESFHKLRFVIGGLVVRQNTIISGAENPLPALPRDGGDIRGGSFFCLRFNRARAFVVSIALSPTRTSAAHIPGYFTAAALDSAARTSSPAFTLCMS